MNPSWKYIKWYVKKQNVGSRWPLYWREGNIDFPLMSLVSVSKIFVLQQLLSFSCLVEHHCSVNIYCLRRDYGGIAHNRKKDETVDLKPEQQNLAAPTQLSLTQPH